MNIYDTIESIRDKLKIDIEIHGEATIVIHDFMAMSATLILNKAIPVKPKENLNWCDFSIDEQNESDRWYCSDCESPVNEELNYCGDCGKRINWK